MAGGNSPSELQSDGDTDLGDVERVVNVMKCLAITVAHVDIRTTDGRANAHRNFAHGFGRVALSRINDAVYRSELRQVRLSDVSAAQLPDRATEVDGTHPT